MKIKDLDSELFFTVDKEYNPYDPGEIYLSEEDEKKFLEKKYNILLKNSSIPEFYHTIDWKDYQGTKSVENKEKVLKFINNIDNPKLKHIHMYIWGEGISTQKTAIACNVGKTAIRQGKRVKFINGGDFVNHLMRVQGFSGHQDSLEYINNLLQYNVLIIDEIFNSNTSLLWANSQAKNQICSALDSFLRPIYSSDITLVLTSNTNPYKIKEKYSEELYNLIDRNSFAFEFKDSIREFKKRNFDKLLEDL
jgi:DNA replication protein DnaC